ncbi:MAG: cytidine deaminase [Bacteroidota bacterium]
MAHKELNISYEVFESAAALQPDERELLDKAMGATDGAYAPFSEFFVGAAVALADGSIWTGNNQENASFPAGTCAERSVLFYLGSQQQGANIRKMAVRARSLRKAIKAPVMPCGVCRQVMLEYEQMAQTDLVVLCQGAEGRIIRFTGVGRSLMPFAFDTDFS